MLLVAVDRCKIRFSGWQVEVNGACACTTRGRRGQREHVHFTLVSLNTGQSIIHSAMDE